MGTTAFEEIELMKDSKYNAYVSAVDKALKNFESSNEWADLILALAKLNKVLLTNTKFPVIPRKIKISKRLAQCMHPALPAGVHHKALEAYDFIFKSMGTNRLSQELFIYSAGLFPLLGHATMSVRSHLLAVYETHFVPLGDRLRPGLPGFLSGVLPGLEDGSDHFVRTNELLEKVCEGVGPSHFYGCVWDCLASNSGVRLPAISFVLSHFDKKLPTEDQPHIMGNNIETMICGLIACVQDTSVLVQRCALDLLMQGFPMHNSHLTDDDIVRLVASALSTILRRDMSLNRRLYAWFLGSEVNMTLLSHHPLMRRAKTEERSTSYFRVFSHDKLVMAIKIILDKAVGVLPQDLRPFKLLVSLLDKVEIGNAIIDDILFEVLRLMYLYYYHDENSTSPSHSELLKCASQLFASLEPRYIWHYAGQLFEKACAKDALHPHLECENAVKRVASGDPGIIEVCTLTEFLLEVVSIDYTDTPSEHLPFLFLRIVTLLTKHCDTLSSTQIAKSLELCAKILTRVQPAIIGHHINTSELVNDPSDSSLQNSLPQDSTSSDFNQNTDNSSIDEKMDLPIDKDLPVKTDTLFEQCLRQYERFYVTFIETMFFSTSFGGSKNLMTFLDSLKIKPLIGKQDSHGSQLDALLNRFVYPKGDEGPNQSGDNGSRGRKGSKSFHEWSEPMKVSSRLLVDLSTLQTFFQGASNRGILDSEHTSKDTCGSEQLPEWLRVLIVCACCLNSAIPLQLTAINTLLDLVTLCRTAQSLISTTKNETGATPVLIVPLLTPAHLKFMERYTYIFQIISHCLWTQLPFVEHKVRCVELLHNLHSSFPENGIVEECIGLYLTAPSAGPVQRLEAFRRFTTLWHIGREVNAKQGNSLRVSDIFHRSMFRMLDNLKLSENDCLKVETQSWLLHSMLRGDIHRILDPILIILLDQRTARLSVLHIRVKQDPEKVVVEKETPPEEDKQIYAISSEDGNVFYHMIDKKEPKSKHGKRITTITDSSFFQKFLSDKKKTPEPGQTEEKPSNEKLLNQNISVYVNPFSMDLTELNTDFDEYYEEKNDSQKLTKFNGTSELDKSKSKSSSEIPPRIENQGIVRNYSLSNITFDIGRTVFGGGPALKLSSIDLLNLSDSIFTKVSDGESMINIRNRGSSFSSEGLSSIPGHDSNELVRSWSFPGKEHETSDLEESTAAEDYFGSSKDSTFSVVSEVVSNLLDKVVSLSGESEPSEKADTPKSKGKKLQYQPTITSSSGGVDHLHSHILLYCGIYDAEMTLYALQTLRNIISANPRAFLYSASSTGLVSRSPILKLLARHRKSLFGRGFSGDLGNGNIKSAMYLEVVIHTCLYFIRSYYPNLEQLNITQPEVDYNRNVQISATELLALICREMVGIVRDSDHRLAFYLADLFSRLKVYKILLHCTLTSLQPYRFNNGQVIHQILRFNDGTDASKDRLSRLSETFQVQLVRLLLPLIILEYEINARRGDDNGFEKIPEGNELKYVNGKTIPQQPLFVTALSKALELNAYSRHTHSHWCALVTCTLPYLDGALTRVVSTALKQLCNNIEMLSECYLEGGNASFPADYGITQVEALTILCHYCLSDNTPVFNQPNNTSGVFSSPQIFNNLTQLFISPTPNMEPSKERPEYHISAKKAVLGNLPRVLASVAVLWQALVSRKEREVENCEVGSPRVVRQLILDFLSPIAIHHATSFLAAMAIVWRERRLPSTPSSFSVNPSPTEDQQVLVQLLNGIKAMPIDVLVQTLHQVVKQPAINQEVAMSVEVSALELFVHYTQQVAGGSLSDCWSSLLSLLKEAPALTPPAQFLLLSALSQFVNRCPSFSDKKDQKDLQDITTKLVESCTTIAGACLEQTTWLRRNLAVREEEPAPSPDKEDKYVENEGEPPDNDTFNDDSILEGKPKKGRKSKLKRVTKKIRQDAEKLQVRALHQWFMRAFVIETNLPLDLTERSKNGGSSVAQYSVSALTVLGQLLAPLLDISFGSQEKERVVTILTNLMYYVTPYLKNHTQRNAGSYYASSQLLASLSGYQYTRKAWKKDAMELLLDSSFFQMEPRAIQYWRDIVDNLISQEASTFRELMNRLSMAQGNALNIFSSKEQEYELRAQLLKRLAFVIHCCENDQFHKHMPDIQERLAESVRLPQVVPSLQAQVFLCFRVLLLRMSPQHVIPLWPVIISEMVQVMMHMEIDLSTDSEEFNSHMKLMSSLDLIRSGNGFQSTGHPSWLQLQLSAANLLFLAVNLPADRLPQFQMYRWAFVGGDNRNNSVADFVPHVTRIARLMDEKYGPLEALPTPLLPMSSGVKTLQDLHPFFTAMSSGKYTSLSVSQLEHNLELDFLDVMAPR